MLLDFLFPRQSLTGTEGVWITSDELSQLRSCPVILEYKDLREQGMESIDRIVAAADYDAVPLLHKAVQALKYKKIPEIGKVLGTMLADASVEYLGGNPVLCPVPLHWIRYCQRGFNQSALLASAVSEARGWPVVPLLRRSRWTGSQVGRKRVQRLQGVRGAFMVGPGFGLAMVPDHVILIDDLSTTGSTLNACAKALKEAGAKCVEGLVLALG